jgi:hypothetical protein
VDVSLPLSVLVLALVLTLSVVALLVALLWRARARWSRASRRRNHHALEGEREAEDLLTARGFRVLDRQAAYTSTMWVDGEPVDFGIRVDLVVEKRGRTFIAEVKTGERAPNPAWGPTRRQLREYATLLPDHGLLLVDVEAGDVLSIHFDESD